MAKITSPLLSKTASGSILGLLVFSIRSSGQQVRFQRAQKDIITNARISQRAIYLNAVLAWNTLSQSEKLEWKTEAKKLHFTGYNLFMQNYLGDYISGRAKSVFGIAIFGDSIFGEV